MNEPRVYKNSPFVFGLLFVMFIVLFGAIFFASGDADFSNPLVMVFFVLMFGFFSTFFVFRATAQTIISNDEISTKNLLGTKTLAWSEIHHVSGTGYLIKLHNFDGDITIAPNLHLPGYNEVIEWIGVKRPDLFDPQEYSEMKKNWTGAIFISLMGLLLLIGLGFFVLTQANDVLISFLVFVLFWLIFVGMAFTTPLSVAIESTSIIIAYFFNKKTISAGEIASIDFLFTQTRNGKNYFIALYLTSGKLIRISGLSPNLPVAYLVLKNWHKKNNASGQTNPQINTTL